MMEVHVFITDPARVCVYSCVEGPTAEYLSRIAIGSSNDKISHNGKFYKLAGKVFYIESGILELGFIKA
jgi:hypothetical protein